MIVESSLVMLVEIVSPLNTKQGIIPQGQKVDLPDSVVGRLIANGKVKPVGQEPSQAELIHTRKGKQFTPEPQWQYDFCTAHAEFNQCQGSCPCSIDDCLLSRVIDAGGDIDKLRGLEIGQGITTDMIIDEWMDAGEPAEDLFKSPTWLICMAEYQRMNWQ